MMRFSINSLLAVVFILIGGTINLISSSSVRIVATIYPVYVVAKEIGQSVCDVENLMPSGASPHDYQIKPNDLAAIQRASVVFMCGLGLDDWCEKVIKKSDDSAKIRGVVVSKGLQQFLIYDKKADNTEMQNSPNPHFWLDPVLMKYVATNIAETIKEIAPDKKDKVDENLKNFSAKMDALDKFIKDELSGVEKRPVICLHNAFAYFGRRYGIEIVGTIQEVPDFPASPRHLSNLTAIARQKKVSVIFGEKGGSNEVAKRLAEDLKLPFAVLDHLESDDPSGADYIERMKRNVEVIKKFIK